MPESQRTVVVTGATGFVGRAFVKRFAEEQGYSIRCMVRTGSDSAALREIAPALDFVRGDITQPASLANAFSGAHAVVNIAGLREFWSRSRNDFYALNQHGARNVFEACLEAGVERVIQVSTPLAFGVPDRLPFDESAAPGAHPSDYARSKFLGDLAGWQLHRERGLPLTVVYLAAVIGAGDDKQTMEVRRAVQGRMPALVGADTTYTYLYLGDAAEAITRALLHDGAVGRGYLIGNQRATTREYFNMIGRIANVSVPARNVPERWLMPFARTLELAARVTGKRPELPLDVLKTTAAGSLLFDDSRAREELGMQYTPLETALAEAVASLDS